MTTPLTDIPKGGRWVITVDGPAGAGKGAVCRAVAAQYNLAYLETGALYRALGLIALKTNIDAPQALAQQATTMPFAFRTTTPGQGPTVWRAFLGEKDVTDNLREEAVGQAASRIAALPPVRSALLAFQRRYGDGQNIILDGRDVGTIVWPDADLKIYLTASLEERAKRRALELQERGENASLQHIRTWMAERDKRDSERSHAPLKPAADAIQVDTTLMTLTQSIQVVASHIKDAHKNKTSQSFVNIRLETSREFSHNP